MTKDEVLDSDIFDNKIPFFFKSWTFIIWGFFLLVGLSFKIMHWPGANILIILTSAGIHSYAFTGFILKSQRNLANTFFSISGLLWVILILWGIFFNHGHPYNFAGFMIYLITFLILFGITALVFLLKIKRYKTK